MLLATKLWATAHLLANGTLADVLLFGGFLAWAVADRISVKRRTAAEAHAVPGAPPGPMNDLIAVAGGLAVYALTLFWAPPLGCSASRPCPEPGLVGDGLVLRPRLRCRAVSPVGHGLRRADEPPRAPWTRSATPSHQPPYKAPPQAPVLYVKPRNTLVGAGRAARASTTAAGELEVGAALGIVIGRTACRGRRGRGAGRTSPATSSSPTSACRTIATSARRSASRRATRSCAHRAAGDRARRHRRCRCARRPRSWSTAGRRSPASTGGTVRGVARLLARRQRLHDARARRRADGGRRRRRAAGRAPAQRVRDRDRRPRPARDPGRAGPGGWPDEARPRRLRRGRCTRRPRARRAGALRLADGRVVAEDDGGLAAAVRGRHHPRARPQLRRPCEGARLQGARRSRWCSSRARAR